MPPPAGAGAAGGGAIVGSSSASAQASYDFDEIFFELEQRSFGPMPVDEETLPQLEAPLADDEAATNSSATPDPKRQRCDKRTQGTAVGASVAARGVTKVAPLKLSLHRMQADGAASVKVGKHVFKVLARSASKNRVLLGRMSHPIEGAGQAYYELVSSSALKDFPRPFFSTLAPAPGRARPWHGKRAMDPPPVSYPFKGKWCREVKFVRHGGREECGTQILLGPLKGIVCNKELLALIEEHVSWIQKAGGVYAYTLSLHDPLQLKACGRSTLAEEARAQCVETVKKGNRVPSRFSYARGFALGNDTRLRLCHVPAAIRGKHKLLHELQLAAEFTAVVDEDERALIRLALGYNMCPRNQQSTALATAVRPRLLLCNGQDGTCALWSDARNCGATLHQPLMHCSMQWVLRTEWCHLQDAGCSG